MKEIRLMMSNETYELIKNLKMADLTLNKSLLLKLKELALKKDTKDAG